jgi:HAD superfamily hydrolase (TIGR01549 family)
MENSLSRKFKAVLFDLDGTLRHHLPTGGEVFSQYLKSVHVHVSQEDEVRAERWTHFYFAHSLEIQADLKAFQADTKKFWVNYSRRRLIAIGLSRVQADELAAEISAHMGTNYKPEVFIPEEAHMLLTALKDAGYILGVVSNRDEPFHEELKELKLDSYFRFALAGGEVQSFKPDLRIFQKGLELAGTSAPETMYIGDNYFADAVGAHRAGLMPVLLDPSGLFPEADCTTIRSLAELHGMLL